MTNNEALEIEVGPRKPGKHYSRSLRGERKIPAVVYGPKTDSIPFYLGENDAVKCSGHEFENAIFVLKSEDSQLNNMKVLKKDASFHKVNRRPIHLDFYALDMAATVRVNVEVKFEGKSVGERDGGVFNALRREVEVECLPTDIPESFSLDISELKMNEVLHVSDINIPEGIKLITSPEDTMCNVTQVAEEKPAETAEGAPTTEAPAEETKS